MSKYAHTNDIYAIVTPLLLHPLRRTRPWKRRPSPVASTYGVVGSQLIDMGKRGDEKS